MYCVYSRAVAALDRAAVVEAAIALADEQGLERVTLRRLAARLGVTAMALYRHVPGKDALLDGMAEALYGQIELPTAGAAWREGLATIARSARTVLLAHPWAVPLFARPLAGPNGDALDAALGRAFEAAGFASSEAQELHDQVSNMLFALVVPELRGRPNRAAFERGLAMVLAGVEARAPTP